MQEGIWREQKIQIQKQQAMSKFFRKVMATAITLIITGCVHTLQVRDLIDLPPPENVRAVRNHQDITVTWQAPSASERLERSGYLLYFATHSLAAIPLAQMPPPLEIAPELSQFTFGVEDSSAIFIHLRTRAGRKQVSLPSLPEVIVPPALDSSEVRR